MVMHRSRRERVSIDTGSESHVKQSEAARCDINRIVAKYRKADLLAGMQANPGRYIDLPRSLDYHECLNQVLQAEEAFAALPANLRKRFENQPMQLLEFVADEANLEEMYELGLAERPKVPAEDLEPEDEPVKD